MSKVQTRAGAAAAARLAYFVRHLSVDLVGIARATKGDVTPAGEKFREILRQFDRHLSCIISVKVMIDPILRTLLRSNTFVA